MNSHIAKRSLVYYISFEMSARSSMLSRGFCNLESCGAAKALTSENVNEDLRHEIACGIYWIVAVL